MDSSYAGLSRGVNVNPRLIHQEKDFVMVFTSVQSWSIKKVLECVEATTLLNLIRSGRTV